MSNSPQTHSFTNDLVHQALRAGGIALWQLDLDSDQLTWSENVEQVLGWASGMPRDFDKRVHPEDQARHQAALHRMLQDGQPYDIEIRFIRPDGRVIWLQDKGERHPRKHVFSGVCLDITARKEAEQALRAEKVRWQRLFERMQEGFFIGEAIRDASGRMHNFRFVEVNPAFEALTGLKPHQAVGRSVRETIPGIQDDLIATYAEVVATGRPVQFEVHVPALGGRWYEARARADGPERFAVLFLEITARKKVEEEVREQAAALARGEERLRLATEATGLGTYDTDLRTGWREWSPQTRTILGLGPDEPVGRRVMENILHPEDRERVVAAHDQAIASPGSPLQIDFRIVRADTGEVRWVSSLSRVLCDADGNPIRLVGTILDRTAAKQAHLALEDSEARYRLLAENTGDIIFLSGPDMVRRYVSPAVKDVLGYEPDDLVGTQPEGIVHPDDRDQFRFEFGSLLSGKLTTTKTSTYRLRHKDGHWVPVEAHRRAIVSATGDPEGVVSVVRDVSERVALEERLRQSQKMEALGSLTGGIAHDFNNLLTVIIGNAEIISDSRVDSGFAATLSRQILEAAEKGADLTQKLLAFARRQSLTPERLNTGQVVTQMLPLLHRAVGEHISVLTDLHESSMGALTDRTLLESAVLNLVVNARDAMPQGGTLTIRTGERHATPGDGALSVGQPLVFVTIADTGTGMSPEVLEHAFDPFFTTKEVGKGSGLGLSMVYGFAQQSGGHVQIRSRLGEGTAVTILLPAVPIQAASAMHQDEEQDALRGSERVLLVEDEPLVLAYVASQLISLGYEVEAVSNGADALERLQEEPFDLLFTDVVLPQGMSGVELARRVQNLSPETKVLLTSGYPKEVFQGQGRTEPGTLLLRKPYRRKELADVLRKAMH